MQEVRVWLLVGELRSHMPQSQKKDQNIKEKQDYNEFDEDFKNGPHFKK